MMRTGITNRQTNSTFGTPAAFQSVRQCDALSATLFDPFSQQLSASKGGNASVFTSIPTLILIQQPSDITRFVMTVYINSVKGVLRRWFSTHFSKELLKSFKTKFNTSCTIAWIVFVALIDAPSFRSVIGAVLSSVSSAFRFAVRGASFSCGFMKTAARACLSVHQIITSGKFPTSAFTFTQPASNRRRVLRTCISYGLQFAKILPTQIFCLPRRVGFNHMHRFYYNGAF